MNLKSTLTFTEVFSSKDVSEERVMHAKSDKMKVTARQMKLLNYFLIHVFEMSNWIRNIAEIFRRNFSLIQCIHYIKDVIK